MGITDASGIYVSLKTKRRMKDEPTDIIDRILTDDVDLLRKWIKEVQAKIKSRTDMTKDFMRHLGRDISDLQGKEEEIEFWSPGYKSSIDKMRSDLRSQINILKSEARNHEVNFWRDVSGLEKELRMLLQAYNKAKLKRDLMRNPTEESDALD